jgi:hypothetical protein
MNETATDAVKPDDGKQNGHPHAVNGFNLPKILTAIGCVTSALAGYVYDKFDSHCRDLGCVGSLWFLAGLIAALAGLIPAAATWLRLPNKPVFISRQNVRKRLYALSIVMLLFSWFVLISSWENW